MSIFNHKLSDEGVLAYVWLFCVVMFIFIIGAIYRCHVEMNDTRKEVFTLTSKQSTITEQLRKDTSENSDKIFKLLERSLEIEKNMEQFENNVIVLAKMVEENNKKVSDAVKQLGGTTNEISEVTKSIREMLNVAESAHVKPPSNANTTETIEQPLSPIVIEEMSETEEKSPSEDTVEKKGWFSRVFGKMNKNPLHQE